MAAAAARGCGVLNSDMISLMSLHGHRCKEALTSESLGAGVGGGCAVVVRQAGARLVCQKKIGHQTPARLLTDERPGKTAPTVIVAARVEGSVMACLNIVIMTIAWHYIRNMATMSRKTAELSQRDRMPEEKCTFDSNGSCSCIDMAQMIYI